MTSHKITHRVCHFRRLNLGGMPICKTCHEEKPEDDFYFQSYTTKDGQKPRMKKCKRCCIKTSAKQREGALRARYLAYQHNYHRNEGRIARKERFVWLNELKKAPCSDCGNTFPPECMDFDHMDPSTKLFNVSCAAVSGRSVESVMAEVAKCRLICANCHRIRTARQQRRGQ